MTKTAYVVCQDIAKALWADDTGAYDIHSIPVGDLKEADEWLAVQTKQGRTLFRITVEQVTEDDLPG